MLYEEILEVVLFGDIEKIKSLIDSNPESVFQKGPYGFTVLHEAVGEHRTEVVQLLLDAKADVSARNNDGVTPLHAAAYPEMAQLLIDHGADIEAVGYQGRTPLIAHAADQDSEDVMEWLLEQGANPMAQDNFGKTALDIATLRQEDDKMGLLKKYERRFKIKLLLNSIANGDRYYPIKAATEKQIEVFTQRASERGVDTQVIKQLVDLYSVADSFEYDVIMAFHSCTDLVIFEWWDDRALWLGQRDFYTLRWTDGKFCLGTACDVSFSGAYEFDTLLELLEGCQKEIDDIGASETQKQVTD